MCVLFFFPEVVGGPLGRIRQSAVAKNKCHFRSNYFLQCCFLSDTERFKQKMSHTYSSVVVLSRNLGSNLVYVSLGKIWSQSLLVFLAAPATHLLVYCTVLHE